MIYKDYAHKYAHFCEYVRFFYFNLGTGAVHPWDNGKGDDRPDPDIFIGKPDLTQQAYAGIGKGMSPSYVWVARKTCQRSRFPSVCY